MGKFGVQITRAAVEDLDAIHDNGQIISDVRKLGHNPLPGGNNIKKLKGFNPPLYRLRSGDYRVLYRVAGQLVTVMRVINRKELERTIKKIR
ncbi:MAG: type II toxin-antitoxin system RelE/ParE family toxin [Deltaproteobacteria bacterium]|nr:type II toxin-antitoxin system RelE/ParE family toxin [Deltaproteobacteria bacterium]